MRVVGVYVFGNITMEKILCSVLASKNSTMKNNNVNRSPTAKNEDQNCGLESEDVKQEQKFVIIFFWKE